ncbi:hypothetical protein IF1G_10351 [Cordyceps javanica]|uniref:Uncharacterized protein n=1 Tax=Cordyceps javanica TaxID=43265 RepID=A0A545UNR7_9HYPO|nr:hypothetical protein IF1G_10351 [Cordyceps javanica]
MNAMHTDRWLPLVSLEKPDGRKMGRRSPECKAIILGSSNRAGSGRIGNMCQSTIAQYLIRGCGQTKLRLAQGRVTVRMRRRGYPGHLADEKIFPDLKGRTIIDCVSLAARLQFRPVCCTNSSGWNTLGCGSGLARFPTMRNSCPSQRDPRKWCQKWRHYRAGLHDRSDIPGLIWSKSYKRAAHRDIAPFSPAVQTGQANALGLLMIHMALRWKPSAAP